MTNTLYVGVSDQHFRRRWELSVRHLTVRDHEPVRGATGRFLCGITGNVWQETEQEYVSKHGRDAICKKCLRIGSGP